MQRLLLSRIKQRFFGAKKYIFTPKIKIEDLDLSIQVQLIHPFFEETFYAANYQIADEEYVNSIWQYCSAGWKEGRNPNPAFEQSVYLKLHPHVAMLEANPFVHYVVSNRFNPHHAQQRVQADIDTARPFFDSAAYLMYNADVAESGMDAVEHFCRYGWRERRYPVMSFDTDKYLKSHPILEVLDLNPFIHAILNGNTFVTGERLEGVNGSAISLNSVMQAIRPAFDPAFYLMQNPDVATLNSDPLEHFCLRGWSEGRDPCADFSTGYYLESNPDVAESRLNPFFHYITQGKLEGRAGLHPGGHTAKSLEAQIPLEEMVALWRRSARPHDQQIDAAQLAAVLGGATSGSGSRLILSVGHDDYLSNSGGVQLCIQQEARRAAAYGVGYLNIHPVTPLPRLAHAEEDPDPSVSLVLDGDRIGVCSISVLIDVCTKLRLRRGTVHVVVHHLMGHLASAIVDLVRATGRKECHLWLHDFFTICPSFALQRNAISFCGAPNVQSNACQLCLYGVERVRHNSEMRSFFDALNVHVLSPSDIAAQFWQDRAELLAATVSVRPHLALDWQQRVPPQPTTKNFEPVIVAFVGSPTRYKGWPQFENLVNTFHHDARFRFLYFGAHKPKVKGLTNIHVHVTAEAPEAMTEALKSASVDLVLNWNDWPETFSFSAHEALAAGAFLLTNPRSGNIAVVVTATQRGIVLRDWDDLLATFTNGQVLELAEHSRNLRRVQIAHVLLGDMTLTEITAEQLTS